MSSNCTVGAYGLPEDVDNVNFSHLFQGFGTLVSSKVLSDRRCGVARFSSAQEAQCAIDNLNGLTYHGCQLVVRLLKEDSEKSLDDGVAMYTNRRLPGRIAEGPKPSDNLYIKGLPPRITDDALRALFGGYGRVVSTRVVQPNSMQGYDDVSMESAALVRMSSVEEAQWIVGNLNGKVPPGYRMPLIVRFADSKSVKRQKQVARATRRGSGRNDYDAGTCSGVDLAGLLDDEEDEDLFRQPWLCEPLERNPQEEQSSATLSVKDLPPVATDLYLYRVFAPFGAIETVRAYMLDCGACTGEGLVKFSSVADAQRAATAVDGQIQPDGHILSVCMRKTGSAPPPRRPQERPSPPNYRPPPPVRPPPAPAANSWDDWDQPHDGPSRSRRTHGYAAHKTWARDEHRGEILQERPLVPWTGMD